ncbi:ArsR/SmtB family transcription factor [Paraburkholderia acidisoli]|uniref:Helix-turn-helix domain-containing protein n=1 Tax=Paraburkholderia acidisoli TaxID=2571748 RepID=A0A7Z2GHK7_9BURK|nr:helix-turn-helix transcriptional regulator [Paraburkholderia acidisoli]QGZ61950.1 helix-turn-helix domain-containing protein [Paraburkholderia acidisoli]
MPLPAPESSHFPGLARVAALLADPGRAAMLWALMDGSARPAGELTLVAGLSPSAASGHLARLTEGGLLALDARGRHRYYRIATPEIAAAIEALMNVAQTATPVRPGTQAGARADPDAGPISHAVADAPGGSHTGSRPATRPARTVPLDMRHARTCYDHMAGEVAVQMFERLVDGGLLTRNGDTLDVTPAGTARLAGWGVDVPALRARRRRFACTCLDWSERRPHLGGALGAALLDSWTQRGWVERASRPRVLRITPPGQREFDALMNSGAR